jgi:hypothetical protein
MALLLLRQVPKSSSLLSTVPGLSRAFGLQGMKGYDDKEAAEERLFFKKEDEKLLRGLLAKVRAQAEAHDVHGATGTLAAERSALDEIVGSKLNDEEKGKLLQWKHTHF